MPEQLSLFTLEVDFEKGLPFGIVIFAYMRAWDGSRYDIDWVIVSLHSVLRGNLWERFMLYAPEIY